MNREQIKKWRDDPYGATGKYGMTRADFKQLCDLALRGLEAGEPVAVVYVADPIPEGTHGRCMSWLVNPVNLPNETKLYASAPSGMVADTSSRMRRALELALEYWAHRQQRYKNRSPAWVQEAREALSASPEVKP